MTSNKKAVSARQARHERVRLRVKGTTQRPRLCVFRSCKHIYAQIIDDTSGRSLVAVSTLSKDVRDRARELKKLDASKVVGERVAELAKEKGITKVSFDRGGFLYHGRIKAVADAARAGGLEF